MIELDVDEYKKGIEDLKFSIVGKLPLQFEHEIPTNKAIKEKLESTRGIQDFKLIMLSVGVYHIMFSSLQGQSLAMSKGAKTSS